VSERALHTSGVCVCARARLNSQCQMLAYVLAAQQRYRASSNRQKRSRKWRVSTHARSQPCAQRNCGAASSSSHLSTHVVDQRALKLGRCIEWPVSTHARSHNLMASATAVAALPPHRMTCMTLAMLPVPHRTQPYQVNAPMTLVIAHALRPLRTALLLPHPTI
jgi:hypothetical protein